MTSKTDLTPSSQRQSDIEHYTRLADDLNTVRMEIARTTKIINTKSVEVARRKATVETQVINEAGGIKQVASAEADRERVYLLALESDQTYNRLTVELADMNYQLMTAKASLELLEHMLKLIMANLRYAPAPITVIAGSDYA